jgi:hypothetical protein
MGLAVHPIKEDLRAFGEGRLPANEAAAVGEHLTDCDSCCRWLETAPDGSLAGRIRQARDLTGIVCRKDAAGPSDHTPVPWPAEVPLELAGHPRYRVFRLLGRGGMGAVYLAEHRHMGRAVALKVINPELLHHPGALPRFQQEVRAAARLDHPNIVAAYDADHAGSLHFLVMEYVEGQNLADYLAARGPLPVAKAALVARQAALGLQHAHDHGMVHRDMKPHNLMFQTSPDTSASPVVKVLDFGLARFAAEPRGISEEHMDDSDSRLTTAGAVVGTADYIAPEQVQDAHGADGRADVYSLGCTLYHLLAGRPPFPEGTAAEKLESHSANLPSPISSLRADVPQRLTAVVSKMMAKRPEDRYQSAMDVAAALAPFTRGKAPRRSKVRRTLLTLAALALVTLTVGAASGVVRIPLGDDREVVIQTDVPDVEVIVKGERIVRIIDPQTGKAYQLDRHDLTLSLADDPGGLSVTLDGKRPIQLKRHGKQIAIVRLVNKAGQLASEEEQSEARAAEDFATGEFYERNKNLGSATFYYELVQRRYPETPYAHKAKSRLAKLASDKVTEIPAPEAPSSGPSWADKLFLAKGKTSQNFGTVVRGTLLKHRFHLRNIYKVPLEIISVRVSAGAVTWNESTKVLKPGEEGYVEVDMDTRRFTGPKTISIYVTVGPQYVSTATLQVSAVSRDEEDPGQKSTFFNGKNLFGWRGLPGYWKVQNGAIVGAPADGVKRHTFLCSEKTYRDFELSFKVKRKGGIGNSGVQIRSQLVCAKQFVATGPQIEIDSANFRFPPGSIVMEPIAHPFVKSKAAVVAKVWKDEGFNDMTIRCVDKWVTVTINGVEVLDTHFPSMSDEGLIAWQLHGGTNGIVAPEEVIFKDIHFTDLSERPTTGYNPLFRGQLVPLFNGNLNGWIKEGGYDNSWRTEDGDLVGSGERNSGFILTPRSYANLRLRFQFKLSAGANSGIGLRAVPGETAEGYDFPHHLEVQILDDGKYRKPDGKVDCPTGSLFWSRTGRDYLCPDKLALLKPASSWNEMEIELRDHCLQVWVNGREVQNADLSKLAAQSEAVPGLKRTSGRIGFQQHTGQVRFRNIQIEELPGPDKATTNPTTSGYRGIPPTVPLPASPFQPLQVSPRRC